MQLPPSPSHLCLPPALRHLGGVLLPRFGSPPGSSGLGGVLASPTSGQKSSPGLTAQQTTAEAEQNLNVARWEGKPRRGQGRKGFLWLLVPAGWGMAGWLAEESSKVFLTPSPAPEFWWGGHSPSVGDVNFRARRGQNSERVRLMTGSLEND